MKFQTLLEKYRRISFSERDKGNRFEHLIQAYLLSDPQYASRLKKVWLWNEFIGRKDLGGTDTGIDLVVLTIEGDYWAIQCKCYDEKATIDKPSVDSFLATSSREFKDEGMKTVKFAHRIWISTTNNWGRNAEEAINNQNPPVTRINLRDLQTAPVDWAKLDKGIFGEESRAKKKTPKHHQIKAVEDSHTYFKDLDRGKLIMACGTGKTFTSLKIAEKETKGKGLVLFLVPSIALLSQSLREWSAEADEPINAVCICSDPEVSKKRTKNEDIDAFNVVDLALPASTNPKEIVKQVTGFKKNKKSGLTVFFSTYQSLDVVIRAQKELAKEDRSLGEFDLIICDEAHRTTGVTLSGEDESSFTKVHYDKNVKAKKRLYMTATPRLYHQDVKDKAAQKDAILCSMDDAEIYGEEIYRIGFGEAVDSDLLTDYKVLILTLSEKDVPPAVQNMIQKDSEIETDDVTKLIGCINALSKQILGDEGVIKNSDPAPMKRAVAFCQKISASKAFTNTFNSVTGAYIESLPSDKRDAIVSLESKHIDGSMTAPQRDELLGWLKEDVDSNECRTLTNVRCLSEGVDVPSLDAVMFLSARNSQVDVVQSVGRVMRKSPGKNYGYIIIPVIVPANVEAHTALDDNERYKVVWTVLNALRAHDDRFNATINKIELNKKRPQQILVGRPETTFENGKPVTLSDDAVTNGKGKDIVEQISLQFQELQNIVFARMVLKVGNKRYWEQWATSVAEIAKRQEERITYLISESGKHKKAFDSFLSGLQKNINPSITVHEAIEMLSQHTITKPVFEALFSDYSFVKQNPISVSMQKMLNLLEAQAVEKDTETLAKFYESVRMRAADIDNAEGKQKIIIELYDKFFKTAFPKMVERLGIVYTPVEIVDFIIHSVEHVLQKEFGRTLTEENVHILDPFTGTGTFITRLLQSGLINKKDLLRKYQHEIHANEIVLLAYYIAAVNIENAFHDSMSIDDYQSFEGICLTDTFQLTEDTRILEGIKVAQETSIDSIFPENNIRRNRQKKAPLRVIIGNPPYSVGQNSANDNAQNLKYPNLDRRIAETYAKDSNATSVKALYDAYIKAFRWSSDRLDKNGGIICFVSNGAWFDVNGMDGFRKCIEEEFSAIYVFNLRGNCRTQGELRRKEAGNVFGLGSRTPIAITVLVKKPKQSNKKAEIFYHDIGDYLSREDKLSIVSNMKSVGSSEIPWKRLSPNEHGDWINARNDVFGTFIPIEPSKKFDLKSESIFVVNSLGLNSNRDAWVYNSAMQALKKNMQTMVNFYNSQVLSFGKAQKEQSKLKAEDFINTDPKKISWSSSLIPHLVRGNKAIFEEDRISISQYRPFHKQFLYMGDKMIHRRGQMMEIFPSQSIENFIICVSAANEGVSALITKHISDLHVNGDSQCFPLYYYETYEKQNPSIFDTADNNNQFVRRDGISDFILERAQKIYGKRVTKEDIFYYVYGFLHAPKYRETFANDLKKMLPRLPLVDEPRDFWKFSKAGRDLAELHINYESVPAYGKVKVKGAESGFFEVAKMRFPKKGQKETIIYNSKITIENIPERAYEYVINGKSAIEWIMERYQVTVHKDSDIKNDPNDWSKEVGNPKYILDLLLSIITVSMQTLDIIESLPEVTFE